MKYEFEEICEAIEDSHQISREVEWELEELFTELTDIKLKDKIVSLMKKNRAQLTYLNKAENWLYQQFSQEMSELQNRPVEDY